MTFRPVSSIKSASKCEWPTCIPRPKTRTKGKKYAGLLYERKLARALPSAIHGQWFHFLDANGPRYCQPDFILPQLPKCIFVLEAKLTWSREAHSQLLDLYVPVVSLALIAPVFPAVVCKHLTPGMNSCAIFTSFSDLFHQATSFNPRGLYVVHWLGLPALSRRQPKKAA